MIRITMQNGKTIDIELDHSAAPITCENFEKLVKDGFYNGLTFHRIIPGFMIQGGDPQGTGMGGPGWHIKGEFLQNGVANPIKHTRGVISMARSMDPNSAGIICAFGLAAAAPRSPYRHLELCGIAIRLPLRGKAFDFKSHNHSPAGWCSPGPPE